MAETGPSATDDVDVRVPADGAYVAALRSMTAVLAARLDFTVDDIEDLRMAVSEATAMVLEQARGGGDLRCSFDLGDHAMTVHVSADADRPVPPDEDSFGWQVLQALTESTVAEVTERSVGVALRVASSVQGISD